MVAGNVFALKKCTKGLLFARVIIVLLIILNFGFIWHNSSKESKASDKTSKKIAVTVAETVVDNYKNLSKPVQTKYVNKYNSIIRSTAHFAEFVPLGFLLLLLALSLFSFDGKKILGCLMYCTLFSLVFSFLIALTDEIHQLFVKGRTFQTIDLTVDTAGALLGCAVSALGVMIFKKK